MTWRHRTQRGSTVLYVVVLSPVLLLALALAVDVGALQLQRQRLHSAVDQAAVVAASSAARAGTAAGLDPHTAAALLRQALVDNLQPDANDLVGTTPEAIAAAAAVQVITDVPASDPFAPGATLTRPTIETRVQLPVRTGLLRLAGVPATVTLTLVAAADLRVAASSP
jgi:Flp pilus assembly protein TadG